MRKFEKSVKNFFYWEKNPTSIFKKRGYFCRAREARERARSALMREKRANWDPSGVPRAKRGLYPFYISASVFKEIPTLNALPFPGN